MWGWIRPKQISHSLHRYVQNGITHWPFTLCINRNHNFVLRQYGLLYSATFNSQVHRLLSSAGGKTKPTWSLFHWARQNGCENKSAFPSVLFMLFIYSKNLFKNNKKTTIKLFFHLVSIVEVIKHWLPAYSLCRPSACPHYWMRTLQLRNVVVPSQRDWSYTEVHKLK